MMNNNSETALCIYNKYLNKHERKNKHNKSTISESTFVKSHKSYPCPYPDINLTHYFYSSNYSLNEYELDNLPPTIIDLTFDIYFNNSVDTLSNLLFIENIYFGWKFNQPIDHLPNSLKRLVFGNNFNHPVDYLPNSLKRLVFGKKFNCTVDHLPNSLKYLEFGNNFDKSIEFLPKSIQYLTVGIDITNHNLCYIHKLLPELIYFQSINDGTIIDNNELHVNIGYNCDISINYLPFAVKKLTFNNPCYRDFKQNVDCLPYGITEINGFPNINTNLPNSIIYLIFGCSFNQPVDNLPCSITHLTFDYSFNQLVDNLPCSITHLTFGCSFNQPVDNLPHSITHLTFDYNFNHPVDNLPCSIIHLTFGYCFDHPVDNLPCLITHLIFSYRFNRTVDNLPHSITHLKFGKHRSLFDKSLENLPSSIKYITKY
jgi:hypothetical protein